MAEWTVFFLNNIWEILHDYITYQNTKYLSLWNPPKGHKEYCLEVLLDNKYSFFLIINEIECTKN